MSLGSDLGLFGRRAEDARKTRALRNFARKMTPSQVGLSMVSGSSGDELQERFLIGNPGFVI